MSISVNSATANPYAAAANNTAAVNTQNNQAQEENKNLQVPQDEVILSGEKPEKTKSTYGKPADPELIAKLKQEVDANFNYLKNIVEGLITKQGKKINSFADFGDIIRGKDVLFADAETISKAKADIADDGYWGVDQTAGRILDFAKALIGDDISKLPEIRDAVEQGFAAAKQALGLKKDENLPDISMRTYDKIMATFDSWEEAGKIG
ncbi:MAG: hypothetical protein LBR56_04255 [Sporomusaceae bacterium]|jgi:hypothetical protein|nr:hypothetical protein [Sporomusaceae bacterium]